LLIGTALTEAHLSHRARIKISKDTNSGLSMLQSRCRGHRLNMNT
jgi:hypothetical protein